MWFGEHSDSLKLFHQFRVCVYIYIYTHLQCGMLSYLEEHVLKQLMYVDKMGSVRKDQVLIFPHFIVKCSVGSVSVDKGQH